jgi:cell division septum initiation protein DivIVA
MREKKSFFGYNPQKVRHYLSVMHTEKLLLEDKVKKQVDAFTKEQAELLKQIENVEREIEQVGKIEMSLKQWIQRNQT